MACWITLEVYARSPGQGSCAMADVVQPHGRQIKPRDQGVEPTGDPIWAKTTTIDASE
jgi:hypothetical protein